MNIPSKMLIKKSSIAMKRIYIFIFYPHGSNKWQQ